MTHVCGGNSRRSQRLLRPNLPELQERQLAAIDLGRQAEVQAGFIVELPAEFGDGIELLHGRLRPGDRRGGAANNARRFASLTLQSANLPQEVRLFRLGARPAAGKRPQG